MSSFFHGKLFIRTVIALTAILLFYVIFVINPCWKYSNNVIELNTFQAIIILLTFFLLSFLVAIISVLAGIGGGILFTPIMMAFSTVDSTIIRGTGLIVAMFSGLISTGPFMKSGIGNLKVSLLLGSCFCVGGLIGANLSIGISEGFGITGEGIMRLMLALLLLFLSVYFIFGSKKIEWPEPEKSDQLTELLNLKLPYHEKSRDVILEYHITNIGKGLFFITIVGFVSGFFGLGGGWAIVPVQNLVMSIPLKVACANSGVLIGIGDCVAIWPYQRSGALIPIFVAPWLIGQVFGGIIGANYLSSFKASKIRYILIGIMSFTSFSLFVKGLLILKFIKSVHWAVYLLVLIIISILIGHYGETAKEKKEEINKFKADKIKKHSVPAIPMTQLIYGKIVYILTAIVACASLIFLIFSIIMPYRNFFVSNTVLFSIFNGKSIQEIWSSVNCSTFSLLNFEALSYFDFWLN
ncbi:MAG: sulfite exporter TauE/SafE family protein, partial [Candidatus Nanoarchaeia archaeon]